ncbi:MAG: hypothetical protein UZ16_OP3001002296 [Candidatus Hinthialibacteria bacterium OLB16]|nr:MAG: hypothetical protein UZ16_OP3001002296 [Candidatus Hinthialibacteria bacterium OLB16]
MDEAIKKKVLQLFPQPDIYRGMRERWGGACLQWQLAGAVLL